MTDDTVVSCVFPSRVRTENRVPYREDQGHEMHGRLIILMSGVWR